MSKQRQQHQVGRPDHLVFGVHQICRSCKGRGEKGGKVCGGCRGAGIQSAVATEAVREDRPARRREDRPDEAEADAADA